jgi:isovaleryl-CoA dehydrogenase
LVHSPDELAEDEAAIVALVAEFVDEQVRPAVRELEHANTYPADLIDQMKRLGIFGLAIPEPWGDAVVSTPCYAAVTEELARGWMSLAGAMGGHTVVAKLLVAFGTDEQKDAYLPRMATGEVRAAMALTEPGGGSDLQAMRTTARREGDAYVVNGSKTWITNSRHSQLFALLCKTDPQAVPAHRGISILLAEKGPGFTLSRDLPKLGYKGVESCELAFDGLRVPARSLLGLEEGRGFAQMMRGLEIGRIQVAARALGVGRAAFEDSLRYAQERESFGQPIWMHQSIGNYLADMGTKLTAARQLVQYAARRYDSGTRSDLEAGMAKLFASEVAMEIALNAVRVHGGYGYSTEFDVERYFRDAPLMIVGEGTNEILRNVIARQLIERHPIRLGGRNTLDGALVVVPRRFSSVGRLFSVTLAAVAAAQEAPRPAGRNRRGCCRGRRQCAGSRCRRSRWGRLLPAGARVPRRTGLPGRGW